MIPELSVPGYKFEGWFADPACTQRITQNTILWVKEDVQIYPKLTLNTFNMTIKLNNNEWAASGINIQIFKIGDVETKVFEATNIQDATFKIDQPFDAGYYRVLASQKATNLEQMVQLGALVWVEGETNYIVDYYSITLTKGDNGINCVYILEENGQVIETEDIHNNAQIYLRGQSIVISAVVAEKDGYSWNDWIDGDTGKPVRSGQDLTITSLEKPYVFTAQSK
ncbi:MAG: InlB B-repeat-containing protein [Clostridia bacterium]|nr:InlB B-repeat-containing protein [Clostridia bacterium]